MFPHGFCGWVSDWDGSCSSCKELAWRDSSSSNFPWKAWSLVVSSFTILGRRPVANITTKGVTMVTKGITIWVDTNAIKELGGSVGFHSRQLLLWRLQRIFWDYIFSNELHRCFNRNKRPLGLQLGRSSYQQSPQIRSWDLNHIWFKVQWIHLNHPNWAHHCMDLRRLEEGESWLKPSSPYLSPSQPLDFRVRCFGCWPLSLGIQAEWAICNT